MKTGAIQAWLDVMCRLHEGSEQNAQVRLAEEGIEVMPL